VPILNFAGLPIFIVGGIRRARCRWVEAHFEVGFGTVRR
jgi:hypothetical protein